MLRPPKHQVLDLLWVFLGGLDPMLARGLAPRSAGGGLPLLDALRGMFRVERALGSRAV